MSENLNVNVGDSVFVTDTNIPEEFVGTHGIVAQIDSNDSALPIFVKFTNKAGADRHYWIRREQFSVVTEEPTRHLSLPANMTLEEAYLIIERYENDYREVSASRDYAQKLREDAANRLTEQQNRYHSDMGSIQRIMLEVKDEQSWCDDGYNRVVERVNDALIGGWEFDKARRLVRKTVRVRAEVTDTVEVWVYDDEDEDDTDNWKDEEGDEVDPDEWMTDALVEEYRRNGFDSVEVA